LDSISKLECKMHRISTKEAGYYYELLIINRTTNNIVIIDHNNSQEVIEPVRHINNTVEIIVRKNNGERREFVKREQAYVDTALDTKRITIPQWHIESSYAHIPEIDAIITNPDLGHTLRHPNSTSTSSAEIVEAVQSIVGSKDGIYLHFLVKDPKGRVEKIYGAFNPTSPFSMEVLCIPTNETNATLTVIAGSRDRSYIREVIDIDPLFENGSLSIEVRSIFLTLGLTSDDAIKAASAKLQDNDRVVYDKVTKMMTNERKDHERVIENLKSAHKLELNELKDKHRDEKLKHKETITTLEDKIRSLNEWKTVFEARQEVSKLDQDLRTYEAKRYESEERLKKAKLATTAETTKLFITVFKVASGVAVGVIIPWIVGKFKEE